jgi:hypothetical protein
MQRRRSPQFFLVSYTARDGSRFGHTFAGLWIFPLPPNQSRKNWAANLMKPTTV